MDVLVFDAAGPVSLGSVLRTICVWATAARQAARPLERTEKNPRRSQGEVRQAVAGFVSKMTNALRSVATLTAMAGVVCAVPHARTGLASPLCRRDG